MGDSNCRKKFGVAGRVDEKLDFLATSKIELFGKRCRKITSLFTAIEQFSSLVNVSQLPQLKVAIPTGGLMPSSKILDLILLQVCPEAWLFLPYSFWVSFCKHWITTGQAAHHIFYMHLKYVYVMQHTYIAGLEALHGRFQRAVEEIRQKPYELLDMENTQFDRDILEFNVNVNDLENSLQVFLGTERRLQCCRDTLIQNGIVPASLSSYALSRRQST